MHIKTLIKINLHVGIENVQRWVIYSLVLSFRELMLISKKISKEDFIRNSKDLSEEL